MAPYRPCFPGIVGIVDRCSMTDKPEDSVPAGRCPSGNPVFGTSRIHAGTMERQLPAEYSHSAYDAIWPGGGRCAVDCTALMLSCRDQRPSVASRPEPAVPDRPLPGRSKTLESRRALLCAVRDCKPCRPRGLRPLRQLGGANSFRQGLYVDPVVCGFSSKVLPP